MKLAVVFSGQGTQHAAMLPWLDDDEVVAATCADLGTRYWRAALDDPCWAANNANAQTLLTGLALAAWRQVSARLPEPAAIAGYSVGELAAFSAAGVFDWPRALQLARLRARAMDACAERSAGGLLAVTGLAPDEIDRLCEETGLAVAIRNGRLSVVLGGLHRSIDVAEHTLNARSVRCTRLRVGLASHTPWMNAAAASFAHTLSEECFERPRVPLFSNAADRVRDAMHARRALATQIACCVRWDECMENIRAREVDCVLEIGPGNALARMWNERHADIPARSCDEFRSVDGIVRWIGAMSSNGS